ncbi:MAG: EamA family transporter [Gammaproteobacteria bacterium]
MDFENNAAWIWIPISVFAALMQAVRTAAQKSLNQHLSTLGTTYVRALFGLPFMALYLGAVLWQGGGGVPDMNAVFLGYTIAGSLAQVIATALLIYMFRLRNFAVGTMLTKADILLTALVGVLFFSETLSPWGWSALLVVFSGVLVMLLGRLGPYARAAADEGLAMLLFGRATQVALACALFFTFSFLFFREATLRIGPGNFVWRGAWTVALSLLLQTLLLGSWLWARQPGVFRQFGQHRALVWFIGFTSALGSIGWFTAFAMQNASYVRAVGQIEAVFTVAIAWLYFKEHITRLELGGIVLTVIGVLMFRLVH